MTSRRRGCLEYGRARLAPARSARHCLAAITLFLLAIVVPSVVLVVMAAWMTVQDRELAHKRGMMSASAGPRKSATLCSATSSASSCCRSRAGATRRNPPSRWSRVDGGRLVLPWDEPVAASPARQTSASRCDPAGRARRAGGAAAPGCGGAVFEGRRPRARPGQRAYARAAVRARVDQGRTPRSRTHRIPPSPRALARGQGRAWPADMGVCRAAACPDRGRGHAVDDCGTDRARPRVGSAGSAGGSLPAARSAGCDAARNPGGAGGGTRADPRPPRTLAPAPASRRPGSKPPFRSRVCATSPRSRRNGYVFGEPPWLVSVASGADPCLSRSRRKPPSRPPSHAGVERPPAMTAILRRRLDWRRLCRDEGRFRAGERRRLVRRWPVSAGSHGSSCSQPHDHVVRRLFSVARRAARAAHGVAAVAVRLQRVARAEDAADCDSHVRRNAAHGPRRERRHGGRVPRHDRQRERAADAAAQQRARVLARWSAARRTSASLPTPLDDADPRARSAR